MLRLHVEILNLLDIIITCNFKIEIKTPVLSNHSQSAIVNNPDIQQLLLKDQIFIDIYELYGTPSNWSRPQGFETLSRIILEQQVSLASANAHYLKLKAYITDFTPENIVVLTDDEMKSNQISQQKAKYLKALSYSVLNKDLDLETLSNLHSDEVRQKLTSIKGIGNWTTDIYLMFCLQSKDVFPIGDIAIINTVKELKKVSFQNEILILSEQWKPLRSLASYFLWHYYLKKRNRPAFI
jgi:DNA-3-methyladenine glycosylase II